MAQPNTYLHAASIAIASHLRKSRLLLAAVTLVTATVTSFLVVALVHGQEPDEAAPSESTAQEEAGRDARSLLKESRLRAGPKLRGTGENREILLRGRVLDANGNPARDFQFVASVYKSHFGSDELTPSVEGSEFEVWVPTNGSHWRYVKIAATANDGRSRAFEGIENRELRQAAIEGIELRLAPANRTVEVSVTHHGAPVPNAHVNAQLARGMLQKSQTNAEGVSTFRLCDGERLDQLTAWTDDFRIGGFSFHRQPRRDPLGEEFTIELDDCRDQTIRFVDSVNHTPIPHVGFELVIGTGAPNYNFAAVPATFPHCRMTTDEQGEATCRWFPDWETHGAYVELSDPRWATAVNHTEFEIGDDGVWIMPLKRRVPRRPLVGQVVSDRFARGGLLVEVKSFQGEEENVSDHIYAFTDEEGNFTVDCIPGATYTVTVNDNQLVSNMIDVIPYELDTGKSNVAELTINEGNLVEIHVTSGRGREPMRNQWVYVRQIHRFDFLEDGKTQSGQGARDFPVYTDHQGIARARAPAGSELRITVYAGEWRSQDQYVTVKGDEVTRVDVHRRVDSQLEVKGRLIAPPDMDVELAGAEIICGSIDGETDERQAVTADAEGRFTFTTKAIQLGIFAYTADGRAAGVVKPKELGDPVELQLKPTADFHGTLLGNDGEPLADHSVRVRPRVTGMRNWNASFATNFETKVFETKTDAEGNYTLENLPTELAMTVRADSVNGVDSEESLDDVFLIFGDERPRMVSRLGVTSIPVQHSLSERRAAVIRDAKLGHFHVLVLSYEASAEDFVNARVLNYDMVPDVASYMNLLIRPDSVARDADREFAESNKWPQPTRGVVFACALDSTGQELGRIELSMTDMAAPEKVADFLHMHLPPQADAQEKWDAAFAEAKRSGRRVWARIGQRYCGPCFRFSRWLDDHHELLERDYVLLKIDDVRDKHGVEIANRVAGNRENYSIPFHTIFDANERLLFDSESPVGNIGHPTSFEGRRHLTKMLRETRQNLTDAEIDQIVATLEE